MKNRDSDSQQKKTTQNTDKANCVCHTYTPKHSPQIRTTREFFVNCSYACTNTQAHTGVHVHMHAVNTNARRGCMCRCVRVCWLQCNAELIFAQRIGNGSEQAKESKKCKESRIHTWAYAVYARNINAPSDEQSPLSDRIVAHCVDSNAVKSILIAVEWISAECLNVKVPRWHFYHRWKNGISLSIKCCSEYSPSSRPKIRRTQPQHSSRRMVENIA